MCCGRAPCGFSGVTATPLPGTAGQRGGRNTAEAQQKPRGARQKHMYSQMERLESLPPALPTAMGADPLKRASTKLHSRDFNASRGGLVGSCQCASGLWAQGRRLRVDMSLAPLLLLVD